MLLGLPMNAVNAIIKTLARTAPTTTTIKQAGAKVTSLVGVLVVGDSEVGLVEAITL